MGGIKDFFKSLKPSKVLTEALKEVSDIAGEYITTGQEKREFEEKVQAAIRKHEQAILEAQVNDRASARLREGNLRNTIGVWTQNIGAGIAIIAFSILIFVIIYKPSAIANLSAANILLGTLGTIVVQIFSYWFGSSMGSKDKQDKLDDLLK